jgi:lysozyme family protein
MTAENFFGALARVLRYEGGWSDNKHDPGGATFKGITQRVYDAYRRAKGLRTGTVRLASAAEIEEIYHLQYWAAISGDELPPGIDNAVFDEAVNSGPIRAIKDLQSALRAVVEPRLAVDGHLGMATRDALHRAAAAPALVIHELCDLRLGFLHRLRTWQFFGKGWSKRIAGVRSDSLALAKRTEV